LVGEYIVGWGGSTTTPVAVGTPNPPMGSVPDDSFTNSCYFRQVTYRDRFKQDTKPGITVIEKQYTDAPGCCSVEHGSSKYEIYGYHIIFTLEDLVVLVEINRSPTHVCRNKIRFK
jgi:hypothetical protein